MKCFVCGAQMSSANARQIENTVHRIRRCGGCGNQMQTVEVPNLMRIDPKKWASVQRVARVKEERAKVGEALPDWAEKAAKDVIAGLSWAEAARRQGKAEWVLRREFFTEEEKEERRLKHTKWQRQLRAKRTPEERARQNAMAHARAEAKERGVPNAQVYEEWGLS